MKYSIEDNTLIGIADAIRKKTSETDAIAVPNMAREIEGIPQGYLRKISRYFEEDTPVYAVKITHNLGTLDYYSDCYIDEAVETAQSVEVANSITDGVPDNQYVLRTFRTDGINSYRTGGILSTENFFQCSSSVYFAGGHTYTFYFYAKGAVNGLPSLDLQDKTITESGFFTPDSGYSGFSSVNVEVEQGETLPENIHTGTLEVMNTTTTLEIEHGFDSPPVYVTVIADDLDNFTPAWNYISAIYPEYPDSNGKRKYIMNYYNSNGIPQGSANINVSIDEYSVTIAVVSGNPRFQPNHTYRWLAYAKGE